ncbi:unnamed protein product [Blepharisma stoltei]|uniref:D-isomer specific 2-hydroxyacid dehydrogenase NAD-binding domain-containing protein n=1 Tax=Blepharisma stoltei TaxID=1481888 RepID=A0AAU9K7G7_9CILI|nr:unnamed protein product [Blepharisma stoltei]
MNAEHVISVLISMRSYHLIPRLLEYSTFYPQLKIECYKQFEEFQSSDQWGYTDVLVLFGKIQPNHVDECVRSNPLKWIHAFSTGVRSFLTEELISSPVPFTNTKGVYDFSLSEYCLGAMLYFNKKIETLRLQKDKKLFCPFNMPTLSKSTIVILGYGSIGKSVARMCKMLNMSVIGIKRTKVEPDGIADQIFDMEKLHEILPSADFLFMALPSTRMTNNVIAEREIALMKKTAVIINVGRGDSINERDLVNALHNRSIAGAALDVFWNEPIPQNSPLWNAPNLLISPHNGGMTLISEENRMKCFKDNLESFLNGRQLTSIVDKAKGY